MTKEQREVILLGIERMEGYLRGAAGEIHSALEKYDREGSRFEGVLLILEALREVNTGLFSCAELCHVMRDQLGEMDAVRLQPVDREEKMPV